jgi:hypothetical protein
MQNSVKRTRLSASRGKNRISADVAREGALLAEFVRHRTVASLAGAIAGRLGGDVRAADLIAEAGLGRAATGAEAWSRLGINRDAAIRR